MKCRLCGNAPESVHHAAFDCLHPDMREERTTTVASMRKLAGMLWDAVDRTLSRLEDRAELSAASGALVSFVRGAPLSDDETAFIGYRLLLATPFPPSRAREYGFYVAAELGAVFASGDARRLRRTCCEWVEWSERRLDAIAGRWKAALLREAQRAAPA